MNSHESTQPCGCDAGAKRPVVCDRHRIDALVARVRELEAERAILLAIAYGDGVLFPDLVPQV